MLEYCGKNTDIVNAEYVLNGSLIGTLSTCLIAYATHNDELYNLVESQGKLYKKFINEYWYRDDAWCYYMRGNGKTVNQDHYVIFEIRILKALFALTKDYFYEIEANRRISMLKNYYQLFIDDTGKYSFIRGGAPHYYYIDIYSTKLSFFDNKGNLIKEDIGSGRAYNDSLMEGIFPEETSFVEWTINTDYYDVKMGKLNILYLGGNGTEVLGRDYEVGGKGVLNDNIISSNTRADVKRITVHKMLNSKINPQAIYGVELNNLDNMEYPMSVVLYDTKGNAVSRTLPELLEGKNLVIFSFIGCKENSDFPLENIHDFSLRIHLTDGDMDDETVNIEIGDTIRFENPFFLYEYLRTSEYRLNFGNK